MQQRRGDWWISIVAQRVKMSANRELVGSQFVGKEAQAPS
jgi:hypothetical protein